MRSISLTLQLTLAFAFGYSQQNTELPVQSKVETVKLYIGGAHITRSASINLLAGRTSVVFKNLPNTIDASTFQVEGEGAFTIMSIKGGYDNKPKNVPKEVRQMRDSLTLLLAQKEDADAVQTVWDEEEKFLNQNRAIGGQQTGVKITELKEAADFYRARLSEIKKGSIANRRKIAKLNEEIERIKARLYPYSADRISLNQELTVIVVADKPVKAKLKVSYFTSSANWAPMYDIRSNGPGTPVNLILKASANNFTGENWDNVQLTFSTGQPQLNANPPTIYPWYIRPVPAPSPMAYSAKRTRAESAPMSVAKDAMELEEVMVMAGSVADFTKRNDAVTSVDYTLPAPYTIVTGKDPLMVEIEKTQLETEYEYLAIPKLAKQVFLMASIANIDRLNLLSANASIYLNNAYTGSAYFDPAMAQDTLKLPLGVDNAITVTRNRIKDFKVKNFIGSKITETVGWEITVGSLKQSPIKLRLTDQIPIATDKSIKVEVAEASKGKLNSENGLMNWDITLEPLKSQTFKLVYIVEYPKEMRLVLE